jgi:hypothetical protein
MGTQCPKSKNFVYEMYVSEPAYPNVLSHDFVNGRDNKKICFQLIPIQMKSKREIQLVRWQDSGPGELKSAIYLNRE